MLLVLESSDEELPLLLLLPLPLEDLLPDPLDDLLLVSRFGLIMFLLIFAALAADVIFLPALLGGTLGRLIRNAVYVDGGDESTESPATVPMPDSSGLLPENAAATDAAPAAKQKSESSASPLKDVS